MEEMERLQKKLIPLNIVVAVLSLVAALTILFAPLLTIDLSAAAKEIIANVETDESGDGVNTDDVASMLDGVNLKLSLTTLTVAKFAFTENAVSVITEQASSIIKENEKNLVSSVAVMAVNAMKNVEGTEDVDFDKVNVDELIDKLEDVFEANTQTASDAAVESFVEELQTQLVTKTGETIIPAEAKEELVTAFKSLCDDAREYLDPGESLTLESFLSITISRAMNGDLTFGDEGSGDSGIMLASADTQNNQGSSSSKDKPVYKSYDELLAGMMSSGSGSGEGQDPLETLNETFEKASIYLKIAAGVLMGFAVVWFIQFIFAFMHIFLKNKRFCMWYTKLFGFTPCLIFGVIPLVAGAVIPKLIPDAANMIAAILGTVSSLTWISGGCYIALWLISIFWAFPIKRKIRRMKKELA